MGSRDQTKLGRAGAPGKLFKYILPPSNRLRGYWYMLRTVVRFEFILMVRYPLNFVSRVVTFLVLFITIFVGGKLIGGPSFDNSVAGLLVGYYLWVMASMSHNGVANSIKAYADWGTLERHFTTPYGIWSVLLSLSLAKLIWTFVISTGILLVLMFVTGVWITVDLLTIGVLITPTIASAIGIGIAAGGFTILYKKIDSLLNLIGYVFIGLISAPAFDLGPTWLLPLAQGSALLQRTMTEGVRFWEFAPEALARLYVVAFGWFFIGFLVFTFAQRRARHLGVLGDY